MFRKLNRLARAALRRILQRSGRIATPASSLRSYVRWVAQYDALGTDDLAAIARMVRELVDKPVITIFLRAGDAARDDVSRSVMSVSAQLYPHWEMVVLGATGVSGMTDPRMRIAGANEFADMIAAARGEHATVLEAGDVLAPHALFMVARELASHPSADLIYSDEDEISADGSRIAPYFKSGWNPDLVLGQDYVCRLGVMRMATVREAFAQANGYEGVDSYALTLRAIEREHPIVRHLPYVLYHRKARQGCPHGAERDRRTVEDHLRRRHGTKAPQVTLSAGGQRRIVWPLSDPEPLVSLIIPTRDRVDLLKACVEGLRHETVYHNLEVIIVDNNSVEPETLAYFDVIRSDDRVRILPYTDPFNFSAINNFAVKHARGDVIGLINNDLKVIEDGWLREMVSHAMRPEVGAVGAMLYYGDDTIQHAGVILGIGTIASHVFKRQSKDSQGYAWRAELTQDLSAVTAACMLMRRAVFDQVGGLDAVNFTVAYNDVDLCLRIRKAGYLVVWTPFARLYHLESASRGRDTSGANKARFAREKAQMLDRWGALLPADPYYSPNLALDNVDCQPAFPPRVTPPWKRRP